MGAICLVQGPSFAGKYGQILKVLLVEEPRFGKCRSGFWGCFSEMQPSISVMQENAGWVFWRFLFGENIIHITVQLRCTF